MMAGTLNFLENNIPPEGLRMVNSTANSCIKEVVETFHDAVSIPGHKYKKEVEPFLKEIEKLWKSLNEDYGSDPYFPKIWYTNVLNTGDLTKGVYIIFDKSLLLENRRKNRLMFQSVTGYVYNNPVAYIGESVAKSGIGGRLGRLKMIFRNNGKHKTHSTGIGDEVTSVSPHAGAVKLYDRNPNVDDYRYCAFDVEKILNKAGINVPSSELAKLCKIAAAEKVKYDKLLSLVVHELEKKLIEKFAPFGNEEK